jgi:hypothetical protein
MDHPVWILEGNMNFGRGLPWIISKNRSGQFPKLTRLDFLISQNWRMECTIAFLSSIW